MLTIMRLASSDMTLLTIPLSGVDDRYCRYRLVSPRADRLMMESLRRYGQVSPVVVGESGKESYVLIDGFKRLRAARRLDLPGLRACIIKAGDCALKAAMFHLNRKSGSLSAIEEAMIVQALHRENNLTQIEIGTLLGFPEPILSQRQEEKPPGITDYGTIEKELTWIRNPQAGADG